MDYILKRSNRQSVQIQIDYDGALIVKAPLKYPAYKINEFIEAKRGWIERHMRETAENNIYIPEHIHILGKHYKIQHVKSLRNFISLKDNILQIESRGVTDYNRLLIKYFRAEAEKYLTQRFTLLNHKTKIFGLHTSSPLKIKKFKRKWGCCSYSGIITLNYKLYHAPENIIDSVIYHELCHLKFFNHSPSFYKLLKEIDPNYEQHSQILKKYAAYLI